MPAAQLPAALCAAANAPLPWLPPLLQGMGVPACRATTCEELAAALAAALERAGPSLIEAAL